MANSKRDSAGRKQDRRVKADWRKALGLPPDYPLFPHQNGRWAKKVRAKLHYFGKVADDPKGQKAIDLWLAQKDDLIAGRTPRTPGDGLTVADLCNRFLHAKKQLEESGEITARHWADYKKTSERIIAQFGRTRLVADLASGDFEQLRASVAKTGGPHTIGNVIQKVRSIFKYAFDSDLIERPVKFGPAFKKPTQKVLRLARREKGPRMLEAAEILALLDEADVQLQAMILLAVNCGFGNSDVGTLPLAALDLGGGWVNYHRPKTGIDRRCRLWPETIAALEAAIEQRPTPKQPEAEPLVFVTKYGAPWAKETVDNPVTKAFRKVLEETKLYRPGLGFYTLRHVFRTVGDGAGDQPAVNSIMGHADPSMGALYRERIDDEQLQSVANHIHSWLYSKPTRGKSPGQMKTASRPAERPRRRGSAGTHARETAEGFQLRIVG